MLVMDENRHFNPSADYAAHLQWMVRRDRNRPSVIMWSVLNEEPMQGSEQGYEMVRRLAAAVKELDDSRPVTAAMNDGMFTRSTAPMRSIWSASTIAPSGTIAITPPIPTARSSAPRTPAR
jgi:beta-galactosidase/beta-glucuronidase